jgi:acyl-CoA dehydrogenase
MTGTRCCQLFPLSTLYVLTRLPQVHIQQVGQRELRRAPALAAKAQEVKKRENKLMELAGLKAHL